MLYAAAPCLFSGVARPQATGLCCPGMFLRFPSCAPSSHRSPLRGFFCPFCGTLPGGGRPGRFPFFSFSSSSLLRSLFPAMLPPPALPLKEGPPQREERPAFERRVSPICHLYLLIPACCMQQHLASFPAWHARRQRGFAVPACSCAFPPAPPPATGPLCGAFFVPSAGRSPVAAGPGAFLFSSFPGHAPPSGASLGRRRAPVRPAERGLYSCRNAPFLFVPPCHRSAARGKSH